MTKSSFSCGLYHYLESTCLLSSQFVVYIRDRILKIIFMTSVEFNNIIQFIYTNCNEMKLEI